MSAEPAKVLWTLFAAILISIPVLLFYILKLRTQFEAKPFPFLSLPAELREMIYAQLIDGEIAYPATKRPSKRVSAMERFFSKRSTSSNSNLIMLANRQIHQEFSAVLCKKAKVTLSLDQWSVRNEQLWDINPETMQNLRNCEVRMIITSNMLGAVDPRHMPRTWPLCDRVCNSLNACTKLQELSLHIRAIGDPLWNPLWVWYHASQSFKTAEFKKFGSITFSLDSTSPGENHLARATDGQWEWRCSAGHLVMPDSGRWQPIREFCHSLYSDCQECISEHEHLE